MVTILMMDGGHDDQGGNVEKVGQLPPPGVEPRFPFFRSPKAATWHPGEHPDIASIIIIIAVIIIIFSAIIIINIAGIIIGASNIIILNRVKAAI